MELKELLKEARKQTGMTQKQFAAYFHIGRSCIRAIVIVAENPYAPYVLMVGNRVQIKRKLFE